MTSIPLHLGSDPSNVVCEVDVHDKTSFAIVDSTGELTRRETTWLHAFNFAQRLATEILKQLPTTVTAPGDLCDLCGGPVRRDDYAEWRMPDGKNGVVHHACVVELILQKRDERKHGCASLFALGGSR